MNKIVLAAACAITAGAAFAQTPNIAKIKADAEAGDSKVQACYAQMLQTGNGVEKNEAEAVKWYQKAADAGYDYAQVNLGVFYQTGGCGLKQDLQKAKELYEKAAAQNNAYAQYYLARLYDDGTGVTKDAQKASEWYGKAAKGGMTAAQLQYALRLAQGEGVAQNITEALVWCEKTVAAGDANGKKLLPMLQQMKTNIDKTPKSLLGIEFGKSIEEVTGQNRFTRKLEDGTAVTYDVKAKKPFRNFTLNNRIDVYASVTSHTVYRFIWKSEKFAQDVKELERIEEVKKTCAVMSKKFGADFNELELTSDDRSRAISYKTMAIWGDLKVEVKIEWGQIVLTATHDSLEYKAKKEVAAAKEAQGDGSDAL